jgi:hypothetical protein
LVKFQDITTTTTTTGNEPSSTKQSHGQPKIFAFTIQHAAATCQGTVTIDTVRYPAVPPVWSLHATCSTGTAANNQSAAASISSLRDGTNPVYDEGLAKLERAVNDDELESLVQADMEETFDWILAHQLRLLMLKWDRWQLSRGDAHYSSHGTVGGARAYRGRDRTSVES